MTGWLQQSVYELRPRRVIAWAVMLAVGGGIAGAVYGIGALTRNAGDAACRPAVEIAHRIAPYVRGEVAALAVAERPFRVPDLVFNDAAGRARGLADWQGRVVLFNLWAT